MYLNPRVKTLKKSENFQINEKCKFLKSKGKTIYSFGFGQSPFPVPAPVIERLKKFAHVKEYLPVTGLPELCKAVADFHAFEDNLVLDKDSVLIGPGSKELMFILQFCFNGETIIPSPYWLTYAPQVELAGRKPTSILTLYKDRWLVQPKQLETHLKASRAKNHLLILNYPGNPSGITYTATELKELADVLRKYKCIVLSDEIYGELYFNCKHLSIASFYPEGTIISSGLSKWCGAGGWRLGAFVFPSKLEALKNAMVSMASETFSCVSAPIQYAAVYAYGLNGTMETYKQHQRRILKKIGNECARILIKGGIDVQLPEGAFYLFPDFSPFREKLLKKGISTSTQLCNSLFEDTKVAILHGIVFGRPHEELTARLAYVDFDGEKALEISRSIPLDKDLTDEALNLIASHVLKGIHKIVEWVK